MKCEICSKRTWVNYGNASHVFCKKCYGLEAAQSVMKRVSENSPTIIPVEETALSRATRFIMMGGTAGAILGVVLSYWLQPGILRMVVSLPQYFKVLLSESGSELAGTAITSIVIFTAIGGYCGYWVSRQRQTSQTPK
ncbi:MAG: hypothetical protein Q8M07_01810 [Prosthecobacter sp.]|nr:hypothetical protein [Prosthecobacter sp.]